MDVPNGMGQVQTRGKVAWRLHPKLLSPTMERTGFTSYN